VYYCCSFEFNKEKAHIFLYAKTDVPKFRNWSPRPKVARPQEGMQLREVGKIAAYLGKVQWLHGP